MLSKFNNSGMITKCRLKELLMQLSEWQEKYILKKLSEFEIYPEDVEDFATGDVYEPNHDYGLSESCIRRFKETLNEEL